LLYEQIKDEESGRKPSEEYKPEEFQKKIGVAAKMISHEATKSCLMFSKPPCPDVNSCTMICQNLEMACLSLVSAYYELPTTPGVVLHEEVQKPILHLITALQEFMAGFESGKRPERQQLSATGNVWECCEALEKLPKDNKEATLKVLKQETALVQDAIEELDMAIQNEEDEEEDWTESDHILLPSCQGLVKAAKSTIKKTRQSIEDEDAVAPNEDTMDSDLDSLWIAAKPISAAVDDFVSSLYPPIDKLAVHELSGTLGTHLRNVLDAVSASYLKNEDVEKWVDFLQNAVKHNLNKVQAITDQKRSG